MNRLDYQTAYGLLTISILIVVLAGLLLDRLWHWLAKRSALIDAKRLNDCKPGCFMMNPPEDLQ